MYLVSFFDISFTATVAATTQSQNLIKEMKCDYNSVPEAYLSSSFMNCKQITH